MLEYEQCDPHMTGKGRGAEEGTAVSWFGRQHARRRVEWPAPGVLSALVFPSVTHGRHGGAAGAHGQWAAA